MPAVYKFRTWIWLFNCLPNHFISSTQTVMKTLKGLFAFILGLVLSLLPILPITAQSASPFYWDFINVDMEVLENGDMQVTETQNPENIFTSIYYALSLSIFCAVLIIYWIENRESYLYDRCPQCKRLKLKRTYLVLTASTDDIERRQRVICECHHCSYRHESDEIIPRSSPNCGGGSSSFVRVHLLLTG
jgi:hypothetical protein